MIRRLLCRVLGHDDPFPVPTSRDIVRWVRGEPPQDGLSTACRRCGRTRTGAL